MWKVGGLQPQVLAQGCPRAGLVSPRILRYLLLLV